MANLFSFLGALVEPVTNLVDEMHTSDEERLRAKQALYALQNQLSLRVLEYEQQLVEAKSKIITAEAQGASWLQRNWRPITMLTFLVLVVLDTLGLTAFRLAPEAWTLLQIGLGGYVIGRSAEKIAPQVTELLSKNKSS